MATTTMTYRSYGTVREYDATRGTGVIETEAGERVFVRYSAIQGEGVRILNEGDRVSFDLEAGTRGLTAVRVLRY